MTAPITTQRLLDRGLITAPEAALLLDLDAKFAFQMPPMLPSAITIPYALNLIRQECQVVGPRMSLVSLMFKLIQAELLVGGDDLVERPVVWSGGVGYVVMPITMSTDDFCAINELSRAATTLHDPVRYPSMQP